MKLQRERHAVIGMGKTGLSILRFLLRKGVSCVAMDEGMQGRPEALQEMPHVTFQAGALRAEALLEMDAVWVSPGVPWMHPALRAARDAGVPVQGDLSLFLRYCDAPVIAVTGTNGKTTTTQTLATLLETLPGGCESGGNIGTPMLDLLMPERLPERVVLELSSFQLERCTEMRPRWAVLLNVQPDHADMHASPEAYRDAKLKLFAHQGEGDTAMLPQEVQWDALADDLQQRGVCVHRFASTGDMEAVDVTAGVAAVGQDAPYVFWQVADARERLPCAHIPACGLHQHINLAVAAQGAADFGVRQPVIEEALSSFRGLPHRLRLIGEVAGHAWFDDSKATNPAAAEAALQSFERVIWVCGGLLKGLDVSCMQALVQQRVVYAVVMGKHPEPFIRLLQEAGVSYTVVSSMQRAVQCSAEYAEALPVLLSPAAASMDQFKNYAERGTMFQQAIHSLDADATNA